MKNAERTEEKIPPNLPFESVGLGPGSHDCRRFQATYTNFFSTNPSSRVAKTTKISEISPAVILPRSRQYLRSVKDTVTDKIDPFIEPFRPFVEIVSSYTAQHLLLIFLIMAINDRLAADPLACRK